MSGSTKSTSFAPKDLLLILVTSLILLVLVTLSLILRGFNKRLRVSELLLERIGHISLDLGSLMIQRVAEGRRFFDIVFYSGPCANTYLINTLLMTDSKIIVIKVGRLISSFRAAQRIMLGMPAGIVCKFDPSAKGQYDLFSNRFLASVGCLDLDHQEKRDLDALISSLRIDTKYVCIHCRDSAYLSNLYKTSSYHHDYRDNDIDNLLPAINFLIDKGYSVVRMGSRSSKKCSLERKGFIDYPFSKYQSCKNDILLMSGCEWWLGSNSGLNHAAVLFGKRIACFDYPICELTEYLKMNLYFRAILQHAKRFNTDTNLTYKEIISITQGLKICSTDKFNDLKISIVRNNSIEILDLAKELIAESEGIESDDFEMAVSHPSAFEKAMINCDDKITYHSALKIVSKNFTSKNELFWM